MSNMDAGRAEFGSEWRKFIDDIEGVARSAPSDAVLVERIVPLLGRLLDQERASGEVIPPKFKQPRPGQYAQYLLHKAADESVCVVSVVWPHGQASPIHDHGTWGVVGLLQNEERETSYRRIDDGNREEYAELQVVDTRVLRPGEITVILPPNDIHRVENAGNDTAISIHIYGKDIGMLPRRVFDPERKSLKTFVSGYTQPE